MRSLIKIIPILTLFVLSGCAQTQLAAHAIKNMPFGDDTPQTVGTFKVGKPYKIGGKVYYPKESYDLEEKGIASWYGPNFHGKMTANGEIFNKYELTAAHKTLQMPSLIRVTNLENGRSLVLRVNDRGPYSRGRVLDVSERAAELLGFKNKGTAKIKLQVLNAESRAIAAAAKRGLKTHGTEVAMNRNGALPETFKVANVQSQPKLEAREIERQLQTQQVATTHAVRANPVSIEAPPVEIKVEKQARIVPISQRELPELDLTPKTELKAINLVSQNDPNPIQGHANQQGQFMPDPVIEKVSIVPSSIYIQVGAFSNQDNALRLRSKLLELHRDVFVKPGPLNGRQLYRVRVGPLANVGEADSTLQAIVDAGFQDSIIVVD